MWIRFSTEVLMSLENLYYVWIYTSFFLRNNEKSVDKLFDSGFPSPFIIENVIHLNVVKGRFQSQQTLFLILLLSAIAFSSSKSALPDQG